VFTCPLQQVFRSRQVAWRAVWAHELLLNHIGHVLVLMTKKITVYFVSCVCFISASLLSTNYCFLCVGVCVVK
jgi:hypothetical protein